MSQLNQNMCLEISHNISYSVIGQIINSISSLLGGRINYMIFRWPLQLLLITNDVNLLTSFYVKGQLQYEAWHLETVLMSCLQFQYIETDLILHF